MRRIAWYLVAFAAILTLSSMALAQGLIGPSGTDYTVRFTHDQQVDEVCLFEVDTTTDPITKVGPVALACTNDVVGDGVTINRLTLNFAPPLSADTPVAATARRRVFVDGEEQLLESELSNWRSLAAMLQSPVLLQ